MLLINNIDISNFKAKLLSRKIKPAKLSNFNSWNKGSLTPFIDNNFFESYKEIDLEFDILCKNANELETMKSNLISEIKKSILKFNDINFKYQVFLDGEPDISYVMPGNEILKLKLLGYCFGDEIIENLNKISNKEITNPGNSKTPVIVEIVPSIDIIDLTINGLANDPITIKNLHVNKKIIIDSKEGTVLEEGVNKFKDTEDFWEFPFLIPGTNTITLSKSNCDVTIRYEPRYL
ncbi:phage distal tail protein [Clostridium perfringens]